MKASWLKGIAIVDLSRSEVLGHVTDVLVDPAERRLIGLEMKGDRYNSRQVVPVSSVRAFGKDAVTIEDASGLRERASFPELRGKPTLDDLAGTKIITEGGHVLGRIKDVRLSDDGQHFVAYEYSTGGIGSLVGLGMKALEATANQRYGTGILTIPDAESPETREKRKLTHQ
jgi:uncharacterized protein YrrD